jgi:hypothetical protein
LLLRSGEVTGPRTLDANTTLTVPRGDFNAKLLNYTELLRSKLRAFSDRLAAKDGAHLLYIMGEISAKNISVNTARIDEENVRTFLKEYQFGEGEKEWFINWMNALGIDTSSSSSSNNSSNN